MPPKKKVPQDIPDIPDTFNEYKYLYNHRIHPFKKDVNDPEDDTKDVLYYNTSNGWIIGKLLCAKQHGLINNSKSVYIITEKIIGVNFKTIIDIYTPILKIGTKITHNNSEITIQQINITENGANKKYNKDNINIDKPFDVIDNSKIKDKTFFSKLNNFVLTTEYESSIQYYYIDNVTDTNVSLKSILFYQIDDDQRLFQ